MTQEDKELLLKDLCARLPYKIYILVDDVNVPCKLVSMRKGYIMQVALNNHLFRTSISQVRPYLRPMSSMSEKEFVYFMGLRGRMLPSYEIQSIMKEALNMPQFISIGTTLGSYSNKIDWLNKNHFDYRGLIPKCLAIEVTEENNPYKK